MALLIDVGPGPGPLLQPLIHSGRTAVAHRIVASSFDVSFSPVRTHRFLFLYERTDL